MFNRLNRVNELLKQEIAVFLEQNAHPSQPITIIDVLATPDLKEAKVLVAKSFSNEPADTKLLDEIKPSLSKFLRKRIKFKFIPKLIFVAADAALIERTNKILEAINDP